MRTLTASVNGALNDYSHALCPLRTSNRQTPADGSSQLWVVMNAHSSNPSICWSPTPSSITELSQHFRHCRNMNRNRNRNNLLMKLASSTWGASANTLRSSALALCYSAAEYCAPIWSRSAHTSRVDVQLNSTMRLICGTLRSTPLRMRTLFRGWPIMVNDTHTRRRRHTVDTAGFWTKISRGSGPHRSNGKTVWRSVWSLRLVKSTLNFCRAMLCISAAFAVVRWLAGCHVRVLR